MQTVFYTQFRHVKRLRGTIPILITCPHGGNAHPAGARERTREEAPERCRRQFRTGADDHTLEIAEGVVGHILQRYDMRPYAVLAGFHRKFVDANRDADCAFSDPAAAPFYDEYHGRIRRYIDQMLEQNDDRAFLFDIHGTSASDNDPQAEVYLGTNNGDSLQPWLQHERLFFRHGLHGLLSAARHEAGGREVTWRVYPPDAETPEHLNGQFTVTEYGKRLTAVQIEINRSVRVDGTLREMMIESLGSSIVQFARRYIQF